MSYFAPTEGPSAYLDRGESRVFVAQGRSTKGASREWMSALAAFRGDGAMPIGSIDDALVEGAQSDRGTYGRVAHHRDQSRGAVPRSTWCTRVTVSRARTEEHWRLSEKR